MKRDAPKCAPGTIRERFIKRYTVASDGTRQHLRNAYGREAGNSQVSPFRMQ